MHSVSPTSTTDPRFRGILLVALAHVVITLPLCVLLNVWTDEAFSLATTSAGFIESGQRALAFEGQPPFYFMVLWLWRSIHSSPAFARFLSVLLVAGSVIFVGMLVKRLIPDRSPVWLTAAYAMHPMVIYAALEIRTYALILFLGSAYGLLFWDRYVEEARSSRPTRLFLMLTAIAGIYTQYFFALWLGALGLYLILRRDWDSLKDNLIIGVATVLAIIPLLFALPSQMDAHHRPIDEIVTVLLAIRAASWNVSDFLVPLPEETVVTTGKMLLTRAFYVLIAVWIATRIFRLFERRTLLVLCGFGGVVAGFAALEYLMVGFALTTRHTIVLLLPTMLLFAYAASKTPWRAALPALTVVWMVISVSTFVHRYQPLAKQGDWERVANLLEQRVDDEPIFVFRPPAALELEAHYEGDSTLLPIPQPTSFDAWKQHEYVLRDHEHIVAVFGSHDIDEGDRLWLATDDVHHGVDVEFGHDILKACLDQCFETIESWRFHKSMVRYLEAGPCMNADATTASDDQSPGTSDDELAVEPLLTNGS